MYFIYFLIIIACLRLGYWVLYFSHVGKEDRAFIPHRSANQSVSIVVCAKNEYENLLILIPALLNQSYSQFEVIIVDDYSTDDTHLLKIKYSNQISWIEPDKDLPGKKYALDCGIKSARNKLVCLTDADCEPGPDWVESMVGQLNDGDVVLGYSPATKTNGWLNKMVRFETIMTALQYFGYALKKIPYMGVGRNILYRKSVYNNNEGLKNHLDILSGDDDLFIRDIARKSTIYCNLESQSFVYTKGHVQLSKFINQKVRHASTSIKYSFKHKLLLMLWAIVHISWTFGFIIGLFISPTDVLLISSLFWGLVTFFHYNAFKKLDGKDLIPLFPILDLWLGINYIIIGIILTYKNTTNTLKWN